jgi:hypothetical protein
VAPLMPSVDEQLSQSTAPLSQAPIADMVADPNMHAFNGGICDDSKFLGFNPDMTSLAMSQLSPLLTHSADSALLAGMGGDTSGHDFLGSAGVSHSRTASIHSTLCKSADAANSSLTPLAMRQEGDVSMMQIHSDPNPSLSMPRVSDMFRSGMHASAADFVRETIREDSVSFLPYRAHSMPNHRMMHMTSNLSSPQGAVGAFGAKSSSDAGTTGGAEFAAVGNGWVSSQTLEGSPWPQVCFVHMH